MRRFAFALVSILTFNAFADHDVTAQLVSRRGPSHNAPTQRPKAPVAVPEKPKEARWLMVGEQKFFQYPNNLGDWMTAKQFVSIPEGSEEVLEVKNREGKTLTITAGYTAFLDPRLGWFVWPTPKTETQFQPDVQEGLFAKIVERVRGGRLKRDTRLDIAARERAKQLASRGTISHTVHGGLMSNFAVRNSGFPLSPGQSDGSNSTESILMGRGTASGAWSMWVTEEGPGGGHHKHIMGTGFSGSHDSYGVGRYGNYWVYLSADDVE